MAKALAIAEKFDQSLVNSNAKSIYISASFSVKSKQIPTKRTSQNLLQCGITLI